MVLLSKKQKQKDKKQHKQHEKINNTHRLKPKMREVKKGFGGRGQIPPLKDNRRQLWDLLLLLLNVVFPCGDVLFMLLVVLLSMFSEKHTNVFNTFSVLLCLLFLFAFVCQNTCHVFVAFGFVFVSVAFVGVVFVLCFPCCSCCFCLLLLLLFTVVAAATCCVCLREVVLFFFVLAFVIVWSISCSNILSIFLQDLCC